MVDIQKSWRQVHQRVQPQGTSRHNIGARLGWQPDHFRRGFPGLCGLDPAGFQATHQWARRFDQAEFIHLGIGGEERVRSALEAVPEYRLTDFQRWLAGRLFDGQPVLRNGLQFCMVVAGIFEKARQANPGTSVLTVMVDPAARMAPQEGIDQAGLVG